MKIGTLKITVTPAGDGERVYVQLASRTPGPLSPASVNIVLIADDVEVQDTRTNSVVGKAEGSRPPQTVSKRKRKSR